MGHEEDLGQPRVGQGGLRLKGVWEDAKVQ